jgi:hypothetical protein
MPKIARKVPEGVPFYGPKSICYCGHTGGGGVSQHADRYEQGHGACKIEGCPCVQFTWEKWTPEYKRLKGLE